MNKGLRSEQARETHLTEVRHLLGKSAYRVERHFDAMGEEEKAIIFAIADICPDDLHNPYQTPSRLRHFTHNGIEKIIKAYKKVRKIAKALPDNLTAAEFYCIDHHIS